MTWRRILIALGVLAVVAGAAVYFVVNHDPGNVSNPNVAFEDETPTPGETPAPGRKAKPEPFLWTVYGYTPDRRRSLDVPTRLVRPPFKKKWTFDTDVLLEFPPVMSAKSLFILRDDGVMNVIDKVTGKVRWSRKVGSLAASSPYLDFEGERLFMTVLSPGRVLAMSTKAGDRGKVLWSRDLPARSESSPLYDHDTVYFGDESGTIYALDADTGKPRWTYRAGGSVKSALAFKDGRLYFGDYSGRLTCLRASDGKVIWQAETQGARFGFASGRFYGNPVVAYGRVFIGNVDSYVYSFSAATGELAWRTKTNGYVYASPTVGAAPGDKPTVYIGSYDGSFYALDARTGGVRWRYYTGGSISGGSTLLGDTIWFADRTLRRSYALDAATGKKIFEYPKGGYATLITDKKLLYLVGYGDMYALEPLSAEKRKEIRAAKRRHTLRSIKRRRDCVHVAHRHRHQHIAFKRCVRRHHAIRTPLHVIRKRQATRRRASAAARRCRHRAGARGRPRSSKCRSGRSKRPARHRRRH
jgi:outer membrane protein assembly factor BamB